MLLWSDSRCDIIQASAVPRLGHCLCLAANAAVLWGHVCVPLSDVLADSVSWGGRQQLLLRGQRLQDIGAVLEVQLFLSTVSKGKQIGWRCEGAALHHLHTPGAHLLCHQVRARSSAVWCCSSIHDLSQLKPTYGCLLAIPASVVPVDAHTGLFECACCHLERWECIATTT